MPSSKMPSMSRKRWRLAATRPKGGPLPHYDVSWYQRSHTGSTHISKKWPDGVYVDQIKVRPARR